MVDSEKALSEAQAHLNVVKSREPEVRKVAAAVRLLREQNHFAEQLLTVIGKGVR